MAAAAINGIGLVLGVLTMVPFIITLIPPTPAELKTNIKVIVGSSGQAGGVDPHIHLFDFQGRDVGIHLSSLKKIDLGVGHDITIEHKGDGAAQAEYISIITGGDDALCISAISLTTPDGINYGFYGDIGFKCGAPWYYGNTTVSADANGIYQPNCIWIDGNGTGGIKVKAYGIHLPSFLVNDNRIAAYAADYDLMCKVRPRFHMYEQLRLLEMLPYFVEAPFDKTTLVDFDRDKTLNPASWAAQPKSSIYLPFKRDQDAATPALSTGRRGALTSILQRPRRNPFRGRLIMSGAKHHLASRLCMSDTAVGPDFVSLDEGIFCDMELRKTAQFCRSARQKGCFDIEAQKMRVDPKTVARDEAGHVVGEKEYDVVEQW